MPDLKREALRVWGLEWEANLTKSDDTLIKAQSIISDLKDQNDKLNKALSEVKSHIDNAEVKANIAKLEQLNTQLIASTEKVQVSVAANISTNAPLVEKMQTPADALVTWGVVYGGDKNIDDAKYEVQTIAPKLGLTNATIYYRQGSYRSVATATDRLQAEQLLNKAKQRRKDSYIINISSWCPQATQKDGYFECSSP
jgi:hypothetical protein